MPAELKNEVVLHMKCIGVTVNGITNNCTDIYLKSNVRLKYAPTACSGKHFLFRPLITGLTNEITLVLDYVFHRLRQEI